MIDVLTLHRDLVSIRSVSGEEAAIADYVESVLRPSGADVERVGNSVLARAGSGSCLCLNSHLDTVPAQDGWTSDPWTPVVRDGRVTGLGANDAKASAAALMVAFLQAVADGPPCELLLMLVEGEETLGVGTQKCLAHLGQKPDAAIVGEPTSLASAVGQYGLLIANLIAHGEACHAAHAKSLGRKNPIWTLARDLAALELVDWAESSLQPTALTGAQAKNQVPGTASTTLDIRLEPTLTPEAVVARIREVVESEVVVHSDRLRPYACPDAAKLLGCVPEPHFVSRTMSDLVFFQGIPAVKIGPGETGRSHTVDEYVMESEILLGVQVYGQIIERYGEVMR